MESKDEDPVKITVRLYPFTHKRLKFLADYRETTLNKLIKEALGEFLAKELPKAEQSLEAQLVAVRGLRTPAEPPAS